MISLSSIVVASRVLAGLELVFNIGVIEAAILLKPWMKRR